MEFSMTISLVRLGKLPVTLIFAMRLEGFYLYCKMPTNRISKTKVFERNFECQLMIKKNAIRSESILDRSTIIVYTRGVQTFFFNGPHWLNFLWDWAAANVSFLEFQKKIKK